MNPFEPAEIERLRRSFASLTKEALPEDGCPAPERIWEAARGKLAPSLTRDLVDHTAACPACAEAWRLAAGAIDETGEERIERARQTGPRWSLIAAAAAALIVAVTLVTQLRRPSVQEDTAYRAPEEMAVRSLMQESEPLSRERCVLRWSKGPPGASYSIEVATEDLTILSTARGLRESEYQVPAPALERLPQRTKVLWRVEALLPDGSRIASATFVSMLE